MEENPLETLMAEGLRPDFNLLAEQLTRLAALPATELTLAVLLEMLLPLSTLWSLSRLTPTFEDLALKVNREGRMQSQRYFAGFMLCMLILLVISLLTALLTALSYGDGIVSVLLLLFLLRLNPVQRLITSLSAALDRDEKKSARRILQPFVLRQTARLSAMGLAKAGCESAVLRLFGSWFAVMVWFLLLGNLGAVLMALSAVLSEAFNVKRQRYATFGLFAARLNQALLIPPALALTVTMLISRHPLAAIRAGLEGFRSYPMGISGYVLALMGKSLGISLGGPRYYEDVLCRYPRLGGERDPQSHDLLRVLRRLRINGVLFLGLAIAGNLCLSEDLPAIAPKEPESVTVPAGERPDPLEELLPQGGTLI